MERAKHTAEPTGRDVRLNEPCIRILGEGARHRDGVISAGGSTGFERFNRRKRLRGLHALGLIEPSPHGDFYITAAGRSALSFSEEAS